MKVQIKDLQPNPYRDMENYPVDLFKIESLKNSIEQTGFWDNIVARPKPNHTEFINSVGSDEYIPDEIVLVGPELNHEADEKEENECVCIGTNFGSYKYYEQPIVELAYGHHRLIAIKELGITEIDIPVKELDDYTMIQIMANENRIEYKYNTDVTIETVKAARDFLNAVIKEYNSWDEAKKVGKIANLFKDENNPIASFGQAKGKQGIGRNIIKKFLGNNWKEWEVKDSLDSLDAKDIDRKALSVFQIPKMANAYKRAIRVVNKEKQEKNGSSILNEDQEKLAEIIKERILPKDGSRPKIFSAGGGSYDAIMETLVRQEVDNTNEYDTAMNEVVLKLKNIEAESNKLANQIGLLNSKFDEMQIEELRSLDTTLMISSFSRLLENINGLSKRLGFEITNLK